jgi:hypothetical protein
MSTTVRTFCHTGLTTAVVAAGTRYTTDSVAMLKQPYVGRSSVTVDSGTAQSTTAAPASAKIVFIQVEAGKAVHYEVNPPNRATAADTSSPILTGATQIEFGPDWTLSFLEATLS